MRPEDAVRIRHMVEAGEAALHFMTGRDRAALDADRMLLFAVVRAVEVLGEAASRVSEETRLLASGVPWSAIVRMRNRLIHGYFNMDTDIVWVTVTDEMPVLLAQLRALLVAN